MLRWSLAVTIYLTLTACGTGAGDPAVCDEPSPVCTGNLVAAVDVYSSDGCERSIASSWCGVPAQALAECLHAAAICVQIGSTRDAIAGVLAASACAAEFAEWDDCFANGDDGGGGDDDDDD